MEEQVNNCSLLPSTGKSAISRKQPCRRCVEWDKAAQCEFLLSRKRGRPQKRATPPSKADDSRNKKHRSFADEYDARQVNVHVTQLAVPKQQIEGGEKHATRAFFPGTNPKMSPAVASRAETNQKTKLSSAYQAQADATTALQGAGLPNALLSLIVEQVRGLCQENRRLVERVSSLQGQQTVFEQQMDALRAEYRINTNWLMNQLAMRHESATLQMRMSSDLLSSPISPSSYTSVIRHILPFLDSYDLSSQELVVNDLQKPFAAFSLRVVRREIVPIFVYTSSSYAELLSHEPGELFGVPVTTICHPEDSTTRDIVLYQLRQPPPSSGVGPVYYTSPRGISKDRRVVCMQSRHQNFYNSAGRCKWFITVVDEVTSRGDNSPRYTGPRETRIMPSPYEHDDEELERLAHAKNEFLAQSHPGTSAHGSSNHQGALDHELEELLHALSPPSPSPRAH